MRTYHKNTLASASITDKKDGKARLVVRILTGQKVHDKVHKSRKAAMAAWYRYND